MGRASRRPAGSSRRAGRADGDAAAGDGRAHAGQRPAGGRAGVFGERGAAPEEGPCEPAPAGEGGESRARMTKARAAGVRGLTHCGDGGEGGALWRPPAPAPADAGRGGVRGGGRPAGIPPWAGGGEAAGGGGGGGGGVAAGEAFDGEGGEGGNDTLKYAMREYSFLDAHMCRSLRTIS
jgi:hypothetical protein